MSRDLLFLQEPGEVLDGAKLGRIKLLRPTLIVRKSSISAPEVKKTERSGQTAPR